MAESAVEFQIRLSLQSYSSTGNVVFTIPNNYQFSTTDVTNEVPH